MSTRLVHRVVLDIHLIDDSLSGSDNPRPVILPYLMGVTMYLEAASHWLTNFPSKMLEVISLILNQAHTILLSSFSFVHGLTTHSVDWNFCLQLHFYCDNVKKEVRSICLYFHIVNISDNSFRGLPRQFTEHWYLSYIPLITQTWLTATPHTSRRLVLHFFTSQD